MGKLGSSLKRMYIFGSHPILDWQRIIVVSVLLITAIFVWSYFFYFSVKSDFGNSLVNVSEYVPVKDKEAEIKEVVYKYKVKEFLWTGGTSTAVVSDDLNVGTSSNVNKGGTTTTAGVVSTSTGSSANVR